MPEWRGMYEDGWTSGHTVIEGVQFAFAPRDAFLLVRTRGWHPWGHDIARLSVSVSIDGVALPFAGRHPGGYVFSLTPAVKSGRSPARVEIASATFRPSKEGLNLDDRDLGVDLAGLAVLDSDQAHAREVIRHVSEITDARPADGFTFDPWDPPIEELRKRGMKVGRNVAIHFGTVIDGAHYWLIEIGDNVTIAPCCHILAHDASTKPLLGYSRIGRVVIEDGVFIGANSVILPGVRIGQGTVVGAGSVVARSLPPNVVAAGNPARVLCSLEEYIERRKREFEAAPRFGLGYTPGGGITEQMKSEMRDTLGDGFGYVV